jgi:hypothetical protein
MTTARTSSDIAAPWFSDLSRALRDAQVLASPTPTGRLSPPEVDRLEQAIEHLGDVLHDASAEVGLEDPMAWRLLEIRDRLASHTLASRALDVPDRAVATRARLLRRGVESAASELGLEARGPDP